MDDKQHEPNPARQHNWGDVPPDKKQEEARPKWYVIPRWRWVPPGGYYGGFFAGFGLCIMILTGTMTRDFIASYRDSIYLVGVTIFLFDTVACYYLESRYTKNRDNGNGK